MQQSDIAFYLRLAYKLAELNSPDPSTRVGAVLITRSGQVFHGWNHLLTGFEDLDLTNRVLKYQAIEHAERDVIYKAAYAGHPVKGATLFCPWAACSACARAISLSGIKEVICHENALEKTPERWTDDIALAKRMFAGAGVKYTWWQGIVGGCENLFNGVYWKP